MGNKVKYNLKNVYAAKLTETPGEDGAVTYSYATPQAIRRSQHQPECRR